MGSMTSRPKVPARAAQPQVIYVPQPQYIQPQPQSYTPPPPQPQPSPDPAPSQREPEKSPEQTESEARSGSLLQRDRSRFGLVKTGFRGLLAVTDPRGQQRKTLLGE